MNTDIIQRLRYKLQKRVRKVNSAGFQTFRSAMKRFWYFLHADELFAGILLQASLLSESAQSDAQKILGGESLLGENEAEETAIAYWVIRHCLESQDERIDIRVAHNYTHENKHDAALEMFKEVFVEPLYEFIDEQLDDQRAVLGLLRRYKHSCEWFRRDEITRIYVDEAARREESGQKSRGEKQLALHLYEYLFNQGLSFSIEPTSISGEADLIAAQSSDDPLVADVKIFDPQAGKNKAYLLSGFHQVYQYTLDFNEPFGYLVIFNACEDGLAISTSQQEQSSSFITFNGKTIFFVVIDMFAHEKSASKRGKLRTYILKEEEFITKTIESENPQEVEVKVAEGKNSDQ